MINHRTTTELRQKERTHIDFPFNSKFSSKHTSEGWTRAWNSNALQWYICRTVWVFFYIVSKWQMRQSKKAPVGLTRAHAKCMKGKASYDSKKGNYWLFSKIENIRFFNFFEKKVIFYLENITKIPKHGKHEDKMSTYNLKLLIENMSCIFFCILYLLLHDLRWLSSNWLRLNTVWHVNIVILQFSFTVLQ